MADDVDYYRRCREIFLKPPEMPKRYNTARELGLPLRLRTLPRSRTALLPDADRSHRPLQSRMSRSVMRRAAPNARQHRDLATIERMLDAVVANEGRPDVVQISGGEPTLHPDFFRDARSRAQARPIQHLMVNTNGIRIARDPEFAERLAEYMPGFEIYLQFDSFEEGAVAELARRRSATHAPCGDRKVEQARYFDDASGHAQARLERWRNGKDHRICRRGSRACEA